jgi:hypothetical protein
VYFGPDGAVNLLFASGDPGNLTRPSGQNYAYKVIDRTTRMSGVNNGVDADVDRACGGDTSSGRIPLGPGERVITPPMVAKGVVAWTSYRSQGTGCTAGQSRLYAMRYDTCEDATGDGNRPAGGEMVDGLPAEPVLHRPSQTLLWGTSAGPSGAQTIGNDARTKGEGTLGLKRLFWRLERDIR